jgi:hypothetical protein
VLFWVADQPNRVGQNRFTPSKELMVFEQAQVVVGPNGKGKYVVTGNGKASICHGVNGRTEPSSRRKTDCILMEEYAL